MESNWRIELYKDFGVYVLAILCAERRSGKSGQGPTQWDFVVRICESGADPTAVETLIAHSHGERPLSTREAVEGAGLTRGYGSIGQLLGRDAVQQSIDL